jgi:hypothetical protein
VRADPRRILSWGESLLLGESYPANLADLRLLLSEPAVLEDGRLDVVLEARFGEGGIWQGAGREFARRAFEVPGLLSVGRVSKRLADDAPREVGLAIGRLAEPLAHPAARLAGDLALVAAAAARLRFIALPGAETRVDLQALVPGLTQGLLESVPGPPARREPAALDQARLAGEAQGGATPEGKTLAETEPALLRVCRRTVARMAQGQFLAARDATWLSWRLYQWLVSQLESLGPDTRSDALAALGRAAPPPAPLVAAVDPLDPVCFDRTAGFDIRLASVVFALLAASMREGSEREDVVTSDRLALIEPGITALVRQIAARPVGEAGSLLRSQSPSDLGWPQPAALPDMARMLLLGLDATVVLRLDGDELRLWIEETMGERWGPAPLFLQELLASTVGMVGPALAADTVEILGTWTQRAAESGPLRAAAALAAARVLAVRPVEFAELAAASVRAHLGDDAGPTIFGVYLESLLAALPEDADREAKEILAAAEAAAPSLGGFAAALLRLADPARESTRHPAQDLLAWLADRPRYRQDPEVREVLAWAGLEVT